MKKNRKTYKQKLKKTSIKRNKKTRKKYRRKRKIKLQKGGSLMTHLIDNNFLNWLIYSFQDFFNNFFGFENNIINPSILKGQFA